MRYSNTGTDAVFSDIQWKYRKLNRRSISSIEKFNDWKKEAKRVFADIKDYELVKNWLDYKIGYQNFKLKIAHTVFTSGSAVMILKLLMDKGLFYPKISHYDLTLLIAAAVGIILCTFIELRCYYELTFYTECASVLQELDDENNNEKQTPL